MKPLVLFLFAAAIGVAEDVKVDLRNPVFKNGILYTNQGGVIKSEDIRIQAKTIQYFHRMEDGKMVQKIEAEGNLLIQYKGRVFVGSELEFDFTNKTGMVYDGKTFSSMWYVGGDQIQLNANGNYKVTNAFITTCENKESSWDLHARRINVIKDQLFQAKKVRLRLFQLPVLWLPSFRLNLKKFKEPIFRYYINWHKGPKLGFRYQLYSWRDFALFGRLEYRWATGWGGAIETEYFPEDKLTTFVTRNYLGTDRLFNAPDVERRYRVQGAYRSESQSGKTHTTLTWDKYNDVRMPGDFKTDDFDVNTAQKTILYIHHLEDDIITYLKVRPRVNPFESIKQDLPTFYAMPRPIEIFNSGVISTNYIRASYLNFQYSDQLTVTLQNFHSPRVELFEKLHRPIHLGPVTVTPDLGGRAIFYGTSPSHHSKCLALLTYGARANLYGQRQWGRYKHVIEPYCEYKALTRPTADPDDHYIFSIQDGYQKLQQIEVGVHTLLFSNRRPCKEASFTADLFANAFFSDPVIPQVVPRLYLFLGWKLPSVHLSWNNCYNFRNHVQDFSNAHLKWTINENIALTLEGRYRSKYDWRKADHENFILDVTREQDELLESPLSDRRITILTNLFIRLTPFWEFQFESHHGLYRLYKNHIHEEPFSEFKVHLYTWISQSWKLHLYYGYTVKNHFDWTINLQLVKKTF
ncbi:MAG TPA: hypothetical protein VLF94_00275 [Chlamydiales bacterium]|nr:hypothetical protein [Chlamydiales bacterium]